MARVSVTPMRLLHTADWHLGRAFEGWSLVDHQAAFCAWLAEVCREAEVDAVLLSGDVYDRAVPALDAVRLLDEALLAVVATCPVIAISGNHDSAGRLGFAGPLLDGAGVHLRVSVGDLDRPIRLTSADGVVALVYGIPYLEPVSDSEALGCERSHAGVLGAAMARVRADLTARREAAAAAGEPTPRAVVLAHGVITGGETTGSEKDIAIGGVQDAPAHLFEGIDYVALGHLHRAQQITATTTGTVLRYSGSPLGYSFAEEGHVKSVTLVDLAADGTVSLTERPTPVPRRLTTLTGTLTSLCTDPALAVHAEDWIRAIVTDPIRPEGMSERLRARFPALVLPEWRPPEASAAGRGAAGRADVASANPVEVVADFIERVTGAPPSPSMLALVDAAVQRVRRAEADQ